MFAVENVVRHRVPREGDALYSHDRPPSAGDFMLLSATPTLLGFRRALFPGGGVA
jgi:hypothetical protein